MLEHRRRAIRRDRELGTRQARCFTGGAKVSADLLPIVATNLTSHSLSVAGDSARDEEDQASVFLPPGPDLLGAIVASDRPTYRTAYRVAAPRLERVPDHLGRRSSPAELVAFRRNPNAILRPRVAIWIEDDSGYAQRTLGPLAGRDLTTLRKLVAATLHDLGGLTQVAVAEWTDDKGVTPGRADELLNGVAPDRFDTRVVRERIAEGRQLWAKLAAWPWWPIAQEAQLTGSLDGWQTLPAVRSTWQMWAA